MTRSHRALIGVMVTMTLAACTIDPVAPSAPPSLDLTIAPTSLSTVGGCASEPIVSGTSTYIVAYSDLPPCDPAPSAAPPDEPTTVAPTPKPDSLSLKLSFP